MNLKCPVLLHHKEDDWDEWDEWDEIEPECGGI